MTTQGAVESPAPFKDAARGTAATGRSARSPAWLIVVVLAGTLLGLGASIIYTERAASAIDDDAISIATDASPAIEHLVDARSEILRIQLEAAAMVQLSTEGAASDKAALDLSLAELHRELDAYAQLPFYPTERDRYAEALAAARALEAQLLRFSQRIEARDAAGALSSLRQDVSPAAARLDRVIGGLISFNAEQQHRLGLEIPKLRRQANRVGHFLEAVTAALGFILTLVVVGAARRYSRLLEERRALAADQAAAAMRLSARLESLAKASVSIADKFSVEDQLRATFAVAVEEARVVADAEYCALGFGDDPERPFEPWVSSGMTVTEAQTLGGGAPHPVDVLRAVQRQRQPLRVADLAEHPDFKGLPEPHPALGPFLGIPLLHDNKNVGNLYLARRAGQPAFSDDDERAASLLASYLAVAIDNARLHGEARAATRAREDLIATVSHDLRNPLNSIRLSIAMLQRSVGDGKGADLVSRIDRASDRMQRMITDLLDAAKIEAGRMKAAGKPEDVASLVREAAEMFTGAAAEKCIELSWHVPASPVSVRCERELILRVLSNLIGNAIKFTPADGDVSVVAEEVDGQVRFSVKDTGPGIPADHMPHIFDRYWQQREGDRRGSGLGLFIARGIVEAHGGRIWADTSPGEGTTLHFLLPEHRADDRLRTPQAE